MQDDSMNSQAGPIPTMNGAHALYTGPTAEDLAHIPAPLTALPQWVLWRGEDRVHEQTGEIKLTKIPIDPQTLANADTTDLLTWGTFDQCVAALPVALEGWEYEHAEAYRGGGLGFVFAADDPYTGIDFDGCVDPDTGVIHPDAAAHMEALDSYTEVTPSRTGLHILVCGVLPPHGRRKGNVEMYSFARFFTMTGWQVPGTPAQVEARQDALMALHLQVFGKGEDRETAQTPPSPTLDDTVLLEKARAAKNAPKFARLWEGDTSLHGGDDSSADMALCCMLAFWTQDPAQIDRLFRQSGLMRKKWGRKLGEGTYGSHTVEEALARQTEHYHRRNGESPDAAPHAGMPAWMKALNRTKGGEVKETFENLTLALAHLAPWSTESWYDLVRNCAMVSDLPLDEPQVWAAARAIEQQTRMPIRNLKLVTSALRSQCHATPRDQLQDWLAALPPWDETPRLTEWLCDHAGVPKTAYTMAVGRLLPVSMVARALHPGIQCRSVVIFEGAQDIGKSRLVKTLAGEEWYREVSGTLEGKEAHMLMKGTWVVELSEMDVLLRTEESRLKSFITMANDEYVPKYANDPVKLARRTVLVGTINPQGDGSYLRDQTGATRYYPVPVDTIDLEAVAACRDQLFAEALVWVRDHPSDWWQMPVEAREELTELREARRQEGMFEGPKLQGWLNMMADSGIQFHTERVLWDCFHIPPERWTPALKNNLGKAIAKGLPTWRSRSVREEPGRRPVRLWCPPAPSAAL
jgi:putative DNA primase/helicase